MNHIKTYLNSLGRTTRTILLGFAVIFVSAGIAQAATTISANISTEGTLNVTGATTLGSTKVGSTGTAMTKIVSGYCVTSSVTILANTAIQTGSSTPAYVDCVPSSTITSSDRVFVQATSSLPSYIRIQAASTTGATAGNISVEFMNTSTSTPVTAATYTLNFWAFQ